MAATTTKRAKVELTIHRAEGLLALNPGNSSNPYLAATVGAQTVMTPVQNKTVNPVFEATFTFVDCPLPTIITLKAFNKLPFADVEDPLGTATLTLFSTCPDTKKTVELTNGGDANLAQRAAANGCGQVVVSYTVSSMPVEEAAAAVAPSPAGVSSLPGSQTGSQIRLQPPAQPSASSSTTTLPSHMSLFGFGAPANNTSNINKSATPSSAQTPVPQPIPVPLAHHMIGAATALPVPSNLSASASSTHLSLAGSQQQQALVPPPLVAANAMMSTPNAMLQRSPKLSTNHSPSSSIPNNAILTPPSVTPAVAPNNLAYYVADSAAAPPANAPAPLLTKVANMPTYTSYPVPGLRPVEAASPSAAPASPPLPDTLYYANNSSNAMVGVSAVTASAPTPHQRPFVPQAATPVPHVQQPNVSNTIHNGDVARNVSAEQQQPSMPNSMSFATPSQAPRLLTQVLVSSPPHMDGQTLPTPTMNNLSAPRTPLTGTAFLPASTAAAAGTGQFPAQVVLESSSQVPSPAVRPSQASASQGSVPVAVAPRTQPLSSSTSTSRTTTPSIHAHRGVAPFSQFPTSAAGAHVTQSPFSRPSDANAQARAGMAAVQPLGEIGAGVCRPRPADVPATAMVGRDAARRKESGTGSRTQSGTRSGASGAAMPSTASATSGAGTVVEASSVYADPTYLFENAASGRDLQVFRKLRQADPHLANGFLQCRDYAGRTLLHIAAWHGQLAVLEVLLAPTAATEGHLPMLDLRTVIAPNSGNTILHAAAYGGQAEVARWLRYTHPTAGALLLDVRNERGMTAAQCAKESSFDTVARLLLS